MIDCSQELPLRQLLHGLLELLSQQILCKVLCIVTTNIASHDDNIPLHIKRRNDLQIANDVHCAILTICAVYIFFLIVCCPNYESRLRVQTI